MGWLDRMNEDQQRAQRLAEQRLRQVCESAKKGYRDIDLDRVLREVKGTWGAGNIGSLLCRDYRNGFSHITYNSLGHLVTRTEHIEEVRHKCDGYHYQYYGNGPSGGGIRSDKKIKCYIKGKVEKPARDVTTTLFTAGFEVGYGVKYSDLSGYCFVRDSGFGGADVNCSNYSSAREIRDLLMQGAYQVTDARFKAGKLPRQLR